MYRVYLVDDDALILEELINTVPWLDNGFEVVGHETDPRRAVEEIKDLWPDVVFCDLKMPAMDGNELIREVKEAGVEPECVMLSAYDSFESVRAFFRQSGFDYLLKPVNAEDMEILLERLNVRLSSSRGAEAKTPLSDNPAFNELIGYVNGHFAEKLTLGSLSERFGLSRNYICGLFQKHFNQSLSLYLTEVRMACARELLESERTMLLKEVARRSGYPDYHYFFKVFKNYYGISPKEMQEKRA